MFGSRVVRMTRAMDSHFLNIGRRRPLNDIGGPRAGTGDDKVSQTNRSAFELAGVASLGSSSIRDTL